MGSFVALMLVGCGSSGGSPGGSGGKGAGGAATAGTGGTQNAGGAGNGGTGGAAGAKGPVVSHTFEVAGSNDGFDIQTYVDTGQYKNLGALAADAGVPDGGTYPTLGQIAGQGTGTPASGALKLTADFTDWQQYVEVKLNPLSPIDLTGTTLSASINVTSPFLGGAFLYAKSGSQYVYASATGTNLASGTFTTLTFDLSTANVANFDPTTIVEFGIHIYSDGAIDGGAPSMGEFTFYIDDVIAQ